MGIDLYILRRGETMGEYERRESAHHFGGTNSTMGALEDLAKRGGVDSIAGYAGQEVVSPEVAEENARKIRALLPTLEPGPPGSETDEDLLELLAAYASFCEQAAEQGGFTVA